MRKVLLCLLLLCCAFIIFGCAEPVLNDLPETDDAKYTSSIQNDTPSDTPDVTPSVTPTTDDPTVEISNLDEISDNGFLSLIDSYTNHIYQSLYEINGQKYGRIIASSLSAEDAVRVCTRHFTDERYPQAINTVIECKVIYESDILYGINVKWKLTNHGKFDGQYEENVISFKKEIADVTVRNVIYGDEESFKICTDQEERINQILMYLYCNKHSLDIVLDYEMSSIGDEYVMTIYSYAICYGDWDMKDEYSLLKYTVIVDKVTGNVNFQEPIVLKTVYK
jgi:hypothetical protein